jgi:hypothetical protein
MKHWQLSIQITPLEMTRKLTTRVVISTGQGDFFSQGRNHILVFPNLHDLFACILVVLHLLFPQCFDEINARNIRADGDQNPETLRVLQMWRDIESSKIWGQFYEAARYENYDRFQRFSVMFNII